MSARSGTTCCRAAIIDGCANAARASRSYSRTARLYGRIGSVGVQRYRATEHVEQLRQLVEAGAAEDSTDTRLTAIEVAGTDYARFGLQLKTATGTGRRADYSCRTRGTTTTRSPRRRRSVRSSQTPMAQRPSLPLLTRREHIDRPPKTRRCSLRSVSRTTPPTARRRGAHRPRSRRRHALSPAPLPTARVCCALRAGIGAA